MLLLLLLVPLLLLLLLLLLLNPLRLLIMLLTLLLQGDWVRPYGSRLAMTCSHRSLTSAGSTSSPGAVSRWRARFKVGHRASS